MAITIDQALNVSTYRIEYNFVQHEAGSPARVAVVFLYGSNDNSLAELHFYQDRDTVSVLEQADSVDIFLPVTLLESVHQTLRGGRPLYISFHRNDANLLNNVWFGTSTKELVEECTNKRHLLSATSPRLRRSRMLIVSG